MLKIRPHHILCIKAYIGKGYSEEFNINIKRVIDELKDDSQEVEVVFGLDDICSKCPYNIEGKTCKSEEKVNLIDSKVREYFSINSGVYKYKELKEMVYSKINENKFEDICGNCQWYHITNCKDLVIK